MYWNNLKSEFYGAKLDELSPIRLRLVIVVLVMVDYVMQRLMQEASSISRVTISTLANIGANLVPNW
jgi:hypothetical protein